MIGQVSKKAARTNQSAAAESRQKTPDPGCQHSTVKSKLRQVAAQKKQPYCAEGMNRSRRSRVRRSSKKLCRSENWIARKKSTPYQASGQAEAAAEHNP